MKIITLILIGLLMSVNGAHAGKDSVFEMYSWRGTGEEWNFAIFPTISSYYTAKVILDPKRTIHGTAELKAAFASLVETGSASLEGGAKPNSNGRKAAGALKSVTVVWAPSPPSPYGSEKITIPPSKVVSEVIDLAKVSHVQLVQ